MRGVILGLAAVCFAAALAVAGAGMRVPPPQTAVPAPEPAAAPEPPPRPAPAAIPAPEPPAPLAAQTPLTVEDAAREQAVSRELVDLRSTVAHLEQELARQRAAARRAEPQGRTVTVVPGDLLPPGQETLGAGAEAWLGAVLPELVADPRELVSVEGHSDSRPIRAPAGKAFKDNADLSLLRARAVAALLQKQGLAPERIRVTGWGDTRPLASNDTAAGRDRNRRVEVRLLPPAPEP